MSAEPWFLAPLRCERRGARQRQLESCSCEYCATAHRVRASELEDMQLVEMRINLGGVR